MTWPTSPELGAESCVEGVEGSCGWAGFCWDGFCWLWDGGNWAKSRTGKITAVLRRVVHT
jgi:hypothetical protein